MRKTTRWPLVTLVFTSIFALYNTLPTLFYSAQRLQQPIGPQQAEKIARHIEQRVATLPEKSCTWLAICCRHLQLTPQAISRRADDPSLIDIEFTSEKDGQRLRRYLRRAGPLIPFAPQRLSLAEGEHCRQQCVTVQLPLPFPPLRMRYQQKFDRHGRPQSFYKQLVEERAAALVAAITAPTPIATLLAQPDEQLSKETTLFAARQLLSFVRLCGANSPLAQRYFASCCRHPGTPRPALASKFGAALSDHRAALQVASAKLTQRQRSGHFLSNAERQELEQLQREEKILQRASQLVTNHFSSFARGAAAWDQQQIAAAIASSGATLEEEKIQTLPLHDRHPCIDRLDLDWQQQTIRLVLAPPIAQRGQDQEHQLRRDAYLRGESARIARETGEDLKLLAGCWQIALSQVAGSGSFLTLDLRPSIAAKCRQLCAALTREWQPQSLDLQPASFPITIASGAANSPLGITLYAPLLAAAPGSAGGDTVYAIVKGLDVISSKYALCPESASGRALSRDIDKLRVWMRDKGFVLSPKGEVPGQPELRNGLIFQATATCQQLLAATRESFFLHGQRQYAILELADQQQRIAAQNRIDDAIQADLLRWQSGYRFLGRNAPIPPPPHNALWRNLLLSTRKYFRGDPRKVLHWGLPFANGRRVEIASNGALLPEMVSALYRRAGRIGCGPIAIRRCGQRLVIDVAEQQQQRLADLTCPAKIAFHVVNEGFSGPDAPLRQHLEQFLHGVWQEACSSNRQSPADVHAIAWHHLHGHLEEEAATLEEHLAARILYQNGLRLAHPYQPAPSQAFDDQQSQVVRLASNDPSTWHGQSHPLLLVFSHHALDQSQLSAVQAGQHSAHGDLLLFTVKERANERGEQLQPRQILHMWSSAFAQDRISGTPRAAPSGGHGWRMAALLDNGVISLIPLQQPLYDHIMISGHFSPSTITRLEKDLPAAPLPGSATIIGSTQIAASNKTMPIAASSALLVLAVLLYYRAAPLLPTAAILLQLLLVAALLQNLQLPVSSAVAAAILLTIGTASATHQLLWSSPRGQGWPAIAAANIASGCFLLPLAAWAVIPFQGFAQAAIVASGAALFSTWLLGSTCRQPRPLAAARGEHSAGRRLPAPLVHLGALLLLLSACASVVQHKSRLCGLDLVGGYSSSIELQTADAASCLQTALLEAGLGRQDFAIQQEASGNKLHLLCRQPPGDSVVSQLQQLPLTASSRAALRHWQRCSGQQPPTLLWATAGALAAALLAVSLYLRWRFSWPAAAQLLFYALSDLLLTAATVVVLGASRWPVVLDQQALLALIALFVYSLQQKVLLQAGQERSATGATNGPSVAAGMLLLVLAPLAVDVQNPLFSFAAVLSSGVVIATLSALCSARPQRRRR